MSKVTNIKDHKSDPLLNGFYTVREAARLLRIDSPQKIRGWIAGHSNSHSGAIIQRTHTPINNIHEVSFLDLMEMRFINYYRQKNIPLQTLRVAAKNARDELKTTHPFALSSVRFMNERKKIFLDTASEVGDRKLLNLITKQFEIYQVLEQILEIGVKFDAQTGLAKEWHPDERLAPNVYINPHYAFGQPVVGEKAIATSAIYKTYQAEEGNKGKVADWYGIDPALVSEAVRFEASLAT